MRTSLLLGLLCIRSLVSLGQPCSSDDLETYQIRASETDPAISFELARHYAWFNPSCTPKNLLLVYISGTFDNPLNTTLFPELAANHGYHVVSLKYPNNISAQNPCRNSADVDCYENFRREIIEGVDYSPDISVDATNSINNRLLKLLSYLHTNHATQGWGQYFNGSTLQWRDMIVAGHSQGGGHAAMIARDHQVHRVIMFASPNDYSVTFNGPAAWTTQPHITPDSSYFAFGNLFDDIVDFSEQYAQWNALGLNSFGDTTRINSSTCPYNNAHQLYTTDMTSGLSGNHNNMVRDNETPLDASNTPLYEPVWKYLLGIPCTTTGIDGLVLGPSARVFPNPFTAQATLELQEEAFFEYRLTLSSLTGEAVRTQTGTGFKQIRIERQDLPKGVYVYQLLLDDHQLVQGRLIIQ